MSVPKSLCGFASGCSQCPLDHAQYRHYYAKSVNRVYNWQKECNYVKRRLQTGLMRFLVASCPAAFLVSPEMQR